MPSPDDRQSISTQWGRLAGTKEMCSIHQHSHGFSTLQHLGLCALGFLGFVSNGDEDAATSCSPPCLSVNGPPFRSLGSARALNMEVPSSPKLVLTTDGSMCPARVISQDFFVSHSSLPLSRLIVVSVLLVFHPLFISVSALPAWPFDLQVANGHKADHDASSWLAACHTYFHHNAR